MATKKKKTKKPAKKKPAAPKPRDEVYLELDGQVHIVSVEDGVTERTEIDPDMVLKILLDFVEKAINAALEDDKWVENLGKNKITKATAGLKKKK